MGRGWGGWCCWWRRQSRRTLFVFEELSTDCFFTDHIFVAYTVAEQITVAGSYMPPVELLKTECTGLRDFTDCACGYMLLTGFSEHYWISHDCRLCRIVDFVFCRTADFAGPVPHRRGGRVVHVTDYIDN